MTGQCKTCIHRATDGYCQSGKLVEDTGCDMSDSSDLLVYPYCEGGGFWVGPNFGCVHHVSISQPAAKENDDDTGIA